MKAGTTERGYGSAHQQEVARRRKQTHPTDLCGYCRQPLGPERLPGDRASRWHLPHNTARTGYLPGMWHADCNRIEGAKRGSRIGNARRRVRRDQRTVKPLSL